MSLQRVKGTNDLLPPNSPSLKPEFAALGHRFIIETTQKVLEGSGAKYIQTPLFEALEVVKRGVGDSTDIVRKEMFSVNHHDSEDVFILRPEGTAPIMRAYLQNGLKQFPSPLKLWTHGPMFRAERPQQGRYRQFHQVDYEVIGSEDALVDAEAITLMMQVIHQIGLKNVELKLGSVGDPEDRASYNAYLQELFTEHEDKLSEDSKARLKLNPMRILDSKSESDQALIAQLQPKMMLDFLGEESKAHFEAIQAYLGAWGVSYTIDPSIVRGLDYYRRTAWEVHHKGVGAKSALGGGGRYDGLAAQLGNKNNIPAIGWACGIERLLIALSDEGVTLPETAPLTLYVAALQDSTLSLAAQLALQIKSEMSSEFAYKAKAPKKHLEDALKKNAVWLAFVGEEEAQNHTVTVKHLVSGEQKTIPQSELVAYLKGNHA